jgi:hypothetical protein
MMETMRRGRDWLRETSWSYLAGVAYFLMALTAIAMLGAEHGGLRMRFANLMMLAAAGLLLAKLCANGYGGAARYRAAEREGAAWSVRLAALLPRLLVAQTRMDRVILRAAVAWLLRRPHPSIAPGRRFGCVKASSYSTLIALGLIGTFVDLPLSAMLASVMSKDPVMQMRIHVLMGALAVYSLFWLLGDRRLMQGSVHVLDESYLHLKIAGRLQARIPLAAIVRGELCSDAPAAWSARHGVPLHTAMCVRASPFDRPNLALFLAPDSGAQFTEWQLARPAPHVVLLHVDEPAQLLAALKTREQNHV